MHRHYKRIKQTTLLAMSQYKNGGRGGGGGQVGGTRHTWVHQQATQQHLTDAVSLHQESHLGSFRVGPSGVGLGCDRPAGFEDVR